MKNLYDKTFQNDVSVVIPVFNRANTIGYCIESIVNQTFLPKEIICVDDCSTDDTKDVIIALSKKYTNVAIKYFCLDKNSGANVARSHGIKKASSMWIAFQDSDDEWEPDKLEKQMMVVREHGYTENIVVHGNCTVVDYASGKSFLWQLPLVDGNSEFVHKRLLCAPGPAFPCILTSKKALETVGLLDGNVPAYQEWDTSLLLSKICRFVHLPDSLFRYHVHNGSIFRKPKRDFLGYQYILNKWKDEIALYCNELQRYRHFRVQIIKLIDLNERANAKEYINEYFKDGDMFLKFIWLCVAGCRGRGIRLVDVLVYLSMYGVNGVMKRMLNKNKEQKFGGGNTL